MSIGKLAWWVTMLSSMSVLVACEGALPTSMRPPPGGRDAGVVRPPDPEQDSGTPPPREDAGVPDLPDTGPPPVSPYPRGPYGTREGGTMPDLWFTTPDGEEVTWSMIRGDRSAKVIVWASGAGWCGPCAEEVPGLIDLHDEYASQGLVVVESLFEDRDYNMASPRFAGEWRSYYDIPYQVFAEPSPSYGQADSIPMTWIIDAETMEVLFFGNSWSEMPGMIERALADSPR